MNTQNTSQVPTNEQLFGWWNVTIETVKERQSLNSGQNKLVVRFVIDDESAKGKIVYGHIPLCDSPRARALIRSFKQALSLPLEAPMPDASQLLGRKLRICNSPWIGNDGVTRESVTAFNKATNIETVEVVEAEASPFGEDEIPF